MLFFDPLYLLFIAPAAIFALWAQMRVKSAYAEAGKYRNRLGLSGAEAAERILSSNGLDIRVERAHGFLSDHYDPRERVLRLSDDVHDGQSLAAVGIAAHEAGHALQQAAHYAPLKLRSGLVPMAIGGSQLSWLLIMVGLVLSTMTRLGLVVALAGVALFGVTVLFQLVNLPVEYDASRRARLALVQSGVVGEHEMAPVSRVLNAAALTYVAATATAIMQMLYYLTLISGSRRN